MTSYSMDRLDSLELEDDWRTLRQSSTAPRTTSVSSAPVEDIHQLESDWNTLKNLPEYVYVARGEATSHFSLWRMRVSGQKKVRRGPREFDCWIVTKDKLIFEWGPSGRSSDLNGTYNISKLDCDLSFEVAALRFKHFQASHLEKLQLEIKYQENQVRAHLAEIRGIKERILSLANVELTPESVKRDELRIALLSVLTQRKEHLRMVDDLEELQMEW